MTLSIIIPVYKVEKYLDYCLTSICRQPLDSCEILLIDDCSPDRSGMLCDEWAQRDARIRVVHHPDNRGLSAARNSGLEQASGEYITFIDSDDYIAPDTLACNLDLLRRHDEADVVEYPVCVYHGTRQAYRYRPGDNRTESFTRWVQRKGYVHSYAWNKIYRRSLWQHHRFPEGRLFEDNFTIPYVLRDARSIVCSNHGLYYYCGHKGSISSTLTLNRGKDLLESTLNLYNQLNRDRLLSETDGDEIYLTLCNHQIVYLQLGGKQLIPQRDIPLRRALLTRRPRRTYIKAVMQSLLGPCYCRTVARTRKLMKK